MKITNDHIKKLDSLATAVDTYFVDFLKNSNLAYGATFISEAQPPSLFALDKYNSAISNLLEIEDAIKRYRENRPQKFEE